MAGWKKASVDHDKNQEQQPALMPDVNAAAARVLEPRLPRGGAQPGFGLHPRHQALEVARGEVEIEILLADVVEGLGIDGRVADVEGFDDAGADLAMTAILPADEAQPGQAGRVFLDDGRRRVARAVVNDDPEGWRQRLPRHTLEGTAGVRRFITARRDEAVAARRHRRGHTRTPCR